MKPALRWTGIVFAFAAVLLLVTVADALAARLGLGVGTRLGAVLAAAVLAGVLTAVYTGARGGMHSFIGGLVSVPVVGLAIVAGAWQIAIYVAAACTLGGAITEIVTRQRQRV